MNARASKVPHPLSKLAALKTRMKTLACSHGQSVSPSAETKNISRKACHQTGPIRDPRLFSRRATDVTEGAHLITPHRTEVPGRRHERAVRCPLGVRGRAVHRACPGGHLRQAVRRERRDVSERTRSSSGPPRAAAVPSVHPRSARHEVRRGRAPGTVRCTLSARRRRSARGSAFSPRGRDAPTRSIEATRSSRPSKTNLATLDRYA